MDKVLFVQNVKFYCERRGIKPTVACRDSGAGKDFLNQISTRGQTPSVEKVEQLAHYLGVTVSELLGEASPSKPRTLADFPEHLTLHDSAIRLKVDEVEMIMAYRAASSDDQTIVQAALRKYKKGTISGVG